MNYCYHYSSPLGGITLVSDGEFLTGLMFDGQRFYDKMLGKDIEERMLPVFTMTIQWLDEYFSGRNPDFVPPLKMISTPFRREVWNVLLSIPYGATMNYSAIARIVAHRRGVTSMSAQAVGGAVVHNPISIIVPCHRVIGAGGSLTGYAGGLERKQRLLQLEGAVL